MTSRKRRPDRAIESVRLSISFKADRDTSDKVKEVLASAVVRRGSCEVRIEGADASEVEEKARVVLEKLKGVLEPPRKP